MSFMRMLYTLIMLFGGGYGLFWLADHNPQLKTKAEQLLDFRYLHTIELRYGSTEIIENSPKLMKEKGKRLLDPQLKFYPLLLMEVKYLKNGKTKEGIALWDMSDGEMILSTETWSKTHGMADCMATSAQTHDLQIINILSEKQSATIQNLASSLNIEQGLAEAWTRSATKKNLVVFANGQYRLHMESPRFTNAPETKIHQALVTKNLKGALKIPSTYSEGKITRLAFGLFGPGFSVKKTTKIYLPVHALSVQTTGGATDTYHYNAYTGTELPPTLFYE